MHIKFATLLVSAGILCGFSAAASAQRAVDARGWYAGIGAGITETKIDNNVLGITGSTANSLSKDESASVYSLGFGYDFSRNWSLEGGFANNGKFSARRTSTAGTVGELGAESRGSALFMNGLYKLPLQNGIYLFGKLGAAYTTTKTDLSTTGAVTLPAGQSRNPKNSEFNLVWGLGAGYDFSPTVGIRLDWTRTENVGDSSTGEGDVNTLVAGLKFRF